MLSGTESLVLSTSVSGNGILEEVNRIVVPCTSSKPASGPAEMEEELVRPSPEKLLTVASC